MNCWWEDKDGNHRYDSFFPEVERPVTAHHAELSELQFGWREEKAASEATD